MCLQGPIIEMVGIQTLVQTANDLVLACNVESDRITVHGYWKTVELFRSEANSLFQSFAGQTFTRQTATTYQSAGSKSTVVIPKHLTSAYLPPKTTAQSAPKITAAQNMTSTSTASVSVTSSVTGSVDRLFANTKVSHTTSSAMPSTASTSSVQTRIAWENPTTGRGKSLPGGVQVLPIELDLVRVTPEVTSSPSVTAATSSVTHASLSSAGIFLTSSSYIPMSTITATTATTTTSTTVSPASQTGITLMNQQSSLETSHSDLLRSPREVKSKIDSIQIASGQVISLKQGDIIKETTDIIVNPANSFLKHEGGIAKGIDNASDGLVQLFSDELVARDGVVPVGGAKYTQAGGQLKCKYVVHTVGPDAKKHGQKECETLLRLSCENSLILADALKATSVSFPAISAGIFSDASIVARVIIKALLEYKYSPNSCLRDIQIVINDQGLFDDFKTYFAKKRKSLGKSREKHKSSRPKSNPMVADHTVTASAAAAHATRSSALIGSSSISTTIPSYTFPSSRHHRTGSLDLDFMKKTKSGSTGFTHNHDQLT